MPDFQTLTDPPARCGTEISLAPNPRLFIVGFPGSGSSLLSGMLNAHPDLVISPKVDWIVGHYETWTGLNCAGTITPEPVNKWIGQGRFDRFELDRQEIQELLAPGERAPFRTFLTRLFDRYGEAKGKRLVGCHSHEYLRDVPGLHALWPDTKFVHLIRDGRDAYLFLSDPEAVRKLQRFATWGEDPITTAAAWWEWHVRLGREGGRALAPGLYLEVRYEALVERPDEECARLCTFLGLAYDPAMLRYHEGRSAAAPRLDAKGAWLPVTAGLRDWRSQMAPDEVERFEAAAGDLLEELGYSRAAPRLTPVAVHRTAAVRDTFERDTRALGEWLP